MCSVSMGIHVHMPACLGKMEDNLEVRPQEQFPPPLRWGLSLADAHQLG